MVGLIAVILPTQFTSAAGIVSSPLQPTVSASGSSVNPTFSADGYHLVFVSHANNLVTNDDANLSLDVFRSTISFPNTIGAPPNGPTNTVLVSVSTNGLGGANADANYPSVSSNGQFVAFASRASNLVPGDNNSASDVFLRDVVNGTTRLVSVDMSGNSPVDPTPTSLIPLSGYPLVSVNGRWVFFESRATNLTAAPALPGSVNIYARDTWSNLTVLVTTTTNAEPLAGVAQLASVTSDGTLIAFTTTNRAVVPGVTNAGPEVYVRDLAQGVTIWASSNAAARMGGAYTCADAQLARDSRVVVFNATAISSGTNAPLIFDLVTSTTTRITTDNSNFSISNSPPMISADGSVIGFQAHDSCCLSQILLWNRDSNAPVLVHQSEFSQPVLPLRLAALSSKSQYQGAFRSLFVAFLDATYSMATGGPPRSYQLFVKDMSSGILRLVSATTNGDVSAGSHEFAAASMEEAFIADSSAYSLVLAFHSSANDLIGGDANGLSDVFFRSPDWNKTYLVSAAHVQRPAATAFAHSFLGPNSVSADGRFIVSTRFDDPSAYRDTNGWADVFVSDALNGQNVAVSINTNLYVTNPDEEGGPMGSFIGNTNVHRNPIISADGSEVNAVRPISGAITTIVRARMTNGVFTSRGMALAVKPVPGYSTSGSSDSPVLSADGRVLVFRSDDRYFSYDVYDGNSFSDIWIRYPANNYYGMSQTNYALLSARYPQGPAGNGPSFAPAMSADAATVAFATRAGDLLPAAAGGAAGQYANYQIVAALLGTNYLATNYLGAIPKRLCSYTISFQQYDWFDAYDTNIHHTNINSVLTPITTDSTNAVFSGNGRYLIYGLTNGGAIWRHDLSATRTNYTFVSYSQYPGANVETNLVPAEPNLLVCTNCRNPVVSADGNVVSYERVRSAASTVDVFATDLNTGEETLVSGNLFGALANGSSTSPVISADGRYVVFVSKGSDLVANDTNGVSDIFVRDRLLGVTMLVSANAQGRAGDGPSTRPVMAADGRTVVFQSFARDLVSGDYNEKRDIFVLKLGGADTDPDGMDDDWEVVYFDNLSRDGDGDFDSDGVSDRAEFLAGTSPTANDSIFRLLTVAPAGGGSTLVMWAGNPSRNYRVEFKDDLNATSWTSLAGAISWNGATASITDTNATTSPHRYYRVARLP